MSVEQGANEGRQPAEAASLLLDAQKALAAGQVAESLGLVRRAIELDPESAGAGGHLGTTLITRRLDFTAGLTEIDRGLALAPDDPGVNYSAGWCYEFVAYRLSRQPRPARDPQALLETAAGYLKRCLELEPEQKL